MTMAGAKKKLSKFVFDEDADEDMDFEDAAEIQASDYPEVAAYAVAKFEQEHSTLFAAKVTDDEKRAGRAYASFLEAVEKLRESRKGETKKEFPGWVGSDRFKFLGAVQMVNRFILQSLGLKSDDYRMFKVHGLGKWLSKWSFYIWHARTPFKSEYDESDNLSYDMMVLEEFVYRIEADCGDADLSVAGMFGERSINNELFPNGWEQFGNVDGSMPIEEPDKGGIRLVLFTIYVASMELNDYGEGRIRNACTYYNNKKYLTLLRHFGCLLVAWAPAGLSSLVELQNISNVETPGKQDSTLYFINNTMHSQNNVNRSNPPNSGRIFGFQNLAILVLNRMFWKQMDCKHLKGCANSAKAKFLRHHSQWFAASNTVEEALGLDYALRDWVKLCCNNQLKTQRLKRGKITHEKRISNLEESLATLQESHDRLASTVNAMNPFLTSIVVEFNGSELCLPIIRAPLSFSSEGLSEFKADGDRFVGRPNMSAFFGTPNGGIHVPNWNEALTKGSIVSIKSNVPFRNFLPGTPETGGTKSRESSNSASRQRKVAPSESKKKEPSSTKKAAQPKASSVAGGEKRSSNGDLAALEENKDEEPNGRTMKKASSSTKKAAQYKVRSAAGDITSSVKRRLSKGEDDEPKSKRAKKSPSSNKKAAPASERDSSTKKKKKTNTPAVARRPPEPSSDSDDDWEDKRRRRFEAQPVPRKIPRQELSDDGSLDRKPPAKTKTQAKAQPKRADKKSAEMKLMPGKPKDVFLTEELFDDRSIEVVAKAPAKAKSPKGVEQGKKKVEDSPDDKSNSSSESSEDSEKDDDDSEDDDDPAGDASKVLEDERPQRSFKEKKKAAVRNAAQSKSKETRTVHNSDAKANISAKAKSLMPVGLAKKRVELGKKEIKRLKEAANEKERNKLLDVSESSGSSDEEEDDGDQAEDVSKLLEDEGAQPSSKEKKKAAVLDAAQPKAKEIRTMQNSREAADDGSVVSNQDDTGKSKDPNNDKADNDENHEDDEENELEFESSEGGQDDEEAQNGEMGNGDEEDVSEKDVGERSEE